jgi:hypothetical protein
MLSRRPVLPPGYTEKQIQAEQRSYWDGGSPEDVAAVAFLAKAPQQARSSQTASTFWRK